MTSEDDTKEVQTAFRYLGVDEEPLRVLAPIQNYENTPLVSFNEAIILLDDIVPKIKHMVKAIKEINRELDEDLTQDESNSIRLYSLEWLPREDSLSYILNKALRSEHRQQLQSWFPFLRLILTALSHLPSTILTVYRSANMDLTDKYPTGTTVTWWGFSTCMKKDDKFDNGLFLARTDERTLFIINCHSGKNIHRHSIHDAEDELLLLPARQFTVMNSVNKGRGLHIIELREIRPAFNFWNALPSLTNASSNISTSKTSFQPVSLGALSKKSFPAALFNPVLEGRIAYMKHRSKVVLKSLSLTDPDMYLVVSEVLAKRQCLELNLSRNQFTLNGISILAGTLQRNMVSGIVSYY